MHGLLQSVGEQVDGIFMRLQHAIFGSHTLNKPDSHLYMLQSETRPRLCVVWDPEAFVSDKWPIATPAIDVDVQIQKQIEKFNYGFQNIVQT